MPVPASVFAVDSSSGNVGRTASSILAPASRRAPTPARSATQARVAATPRYIFRLTTMSGGASVDTSALVGTECLDLRVGRRGGVELVTEPLLGQAPGQLNADDPLAHAEHLSVVAQDLSLIHISEPTRRTPISYAVFCLKKKKKKQKQ